jgi:hypothetical protein
MTDKEIERRRKMFHWFIDGVIGGIGHLTPDGKVVYSTIHGLSWNDYKYLTPDWVTEHYNVDL